jgi:serralysin
MAHFNGTEGTDFFFGTEEDDFINGKGGDDDLHGAGGNDVVAGGEGNDILSGGEGNDVVSGGEGNDNLGWIAGDDILLGGDGDDHLSVWAIEGSDDVFLSGGDGTDSLDVVGTGPVTINLEEGFMTTTTNQGAAVSIQLASIEDVFVGSDSSANVIGNAEDNFFFVTNGDDTLNGREGNDFLFAGPGEDTYVLDAAPGEANADRIIIENYSAEVDGFDERDTIALDNDVMAALGAEGDFGTEDERFYAAAGATGGAEEDDRVIYDTEAGRLYYDADGSGAGEAQLIATLVVHGQPLAASDITVI